MTSPSAMRAAMEAQSGLTSAMQHHMAMKVLHLKCLEAVTAIMTGRKVKGVQLMKLSTEYVPVAAKAGKKWVMMISAPCTRPAAARMYTKGANTADMVAMMRLPRPCLTSGAAAVLLSRSSSWASASYTSLAWVPMTT